MKVGIIVRGIALTDAIRAYANRRLCTAFGRYQQALQSVQLRSTDVNGPRGGIDKHCVIEVRAAAALHPKPKTRRPHCPTS